MYLKCNKSSTIGDRLWWIHFHFYFIYCMYKSNIFKMLRVFFAFFAGNGVFLECINVLFGISLIQLNTPFRLIFC